MNSGILMKHFHVGSGWNLQSSKYYNDDKLVIRLTFIHMKVGIWSFDNLFVNFHIFWDVYFFTPTWRLSRHATMHSHKMSFWWSLSMQWWYRWFVGCYNYSCVKINLNISLCHQISLIFPLGMFSMDARLQSAIFLPKNNLYWIFLPKNNL